MEIPTAIRDAVTMKSTGANRDPRPVLTPTVIACMNRKYGGGLEHTVSSDGDLFSDGLNEAFVMFLMTDGAEPETIDDFFPDIAATNPGATGAIRASDPLFAEDIYSLLEMCATEKPDIKGIQNKVADREGRKAYRAMVGWQGPVEASSSSSSAAAESIARRRELPEEVARRIAKFAAVKKHGGRTKKQTKKTKKSKKTTRRR